MTASGASIGAHVLRPWLRDRAYRRRHAIVHCAGLPVDRARCLKMPRACRPASAGAVGRPGPSARSRAAAWRWPDPTAIGEQMPADRRPVDIANARMRSITSAYMRAPGDALCTARRVSDCWPAAPGLAAAVVDARALDRWRIFADTSSASTPMTAGYAFIVPHAADRRRSAVRGDSSRTQDERHESSATRHQRARTGSARCW